MGLFGLLCTVITGSALISSTKKEVSYTNNSKENARNNKQLTYSDYQGNEHLTSTGQSVYTYNGKILDKNTGQVLIDYKKEKEERERKETIYKAKEKGLSYVFLYYPEFKRAYYTELSTMKRYYLYGYTALNGEGKFKKIYYSNGSSQSSIQDYSIEIDKNEFCALGGHIRSFSDLQYIGRF